MGSRYRSLPEPRELGKRENPNEGRCTLVVGKLGSGKTSYAVMRAVKEARFYRLPLYSNAPIRDDSTLLHDWSDLRALELDDIGRHPAVIVLDELHLWYPSASGLMPKERMQEAFELLSYARKRGWSIYATSQAVTRVHTGFRQIMTELVQVQPAMKGTWHTASMMDPDTYKLDLRYMGGFSPRRARYNTRAEVTPLWVAGKPSRSLDDHPPLFPTAPTV